MRTPQRHQARDSGFLARQARVKRGTLAAAARADDRLGRRSAAGTPSAPGCCGSARLRASTFIRISGARQRGALPGQVAGQRPGPVQHCRDLIGAIGLRPGAGRRDRPPHPSSTGHPTPQEQSPRQHQHGREGAHRGQPSAVAAGPGKPVTPSGSLAAGKALPRQAGTVRSPSRQHQPAKLPASRGAAPHPTPGASPRAAKDRFPGSACRRSPSTCAGHLRRS